MESNRVEIFSDAVIAIILTIMVLELKVPKDESLSALTQLYPVFLSYVLSFVYVAIYWNNHHHLFQAVKHIDGKALWANLHVLFWLSLFPFASGWMGENDFALYPVLFYGFVLLMAALSYYILVHTLIRHPNDNPELSKAIGKDTKGKISILGYAAAIGLAFIHPYIGIGLYALMALLWLIPDRRIEEQKEITHATDR